MHNFDIIVKICSVGVEGGRKEEVKIQGYSMKQCAKPSDSILLLKLPSFFHTYTGDDQTVIFSCWVINVC